MGFFFLCLRVASVKPNDALPFAVGVDSPAIPFISAE